MSNYYENENKKIMNSYLLKLVEIAEIQKQTAVSSDKFNLFFNRIAGKILYFAELAEELRNNTDYFSTKTLNELQQINMSFYAEILPENYAACYANPAYNADIFGNEIGPVLSYFYIFYRQYPSYAIKQQLFLMEQRNRLFIDVFNLLTKDGSEVDIDVLKKMICRIDAAPDLEKDLLFTRQNYDPGFRFYLDIIEKSDLSDSRYLYKYDNYISANEIRVAQFLQNYPQSKIDKIAQTFTDAFLQGLAKKGAKVKSTVALYFSAGYEKIARGIISSFKAQNITVLVNYVGTTSTNRQYWYDQRYNHALYYNEEFAKKSLDNFKTACEANIDLVKGHFGGLSFGSFGENPFSPVPKSVCLKLTQEQIDLENSMTNEINEVYLQLFPAKERSYSMMDFPSPEIGDNFESIFEDMLEINSLDSSKYEVIQQKMIDVLDKADFVHIKGKGKNQTDIKVKMQTLVNPEKETNFNNCGADVNIPVGEVFTTPQLAGTEGVLHIEDAFLGSFAYENLKLSFKDGYVVDYSCTNQENAEAGRTYIYENLLQKHNTLPLGEFAIGTNTLAYMKAKKHGIIKLLSVLILEKMGPHFAIGDTCYSWDEDTPLYNHLNKKRLTAVENEKTALRKNSADEAYTNVHTDITLPFVSIEFITAVSKESERTDIIKDGRFVLQGTEELNLPFDSK